MKKVLCLICAFITAASLAACDDAKSGTSTVADSAKVTTAAPAAPETTAAVTEKTSADLGNIEIDMTEMNSTMVYTQVSDMLTTPDDYLGKTVKMTGTFSIYEGDTRNYYACLIADATACCSQGIEFVLDGDFKYPDDYPALGTDITVTGVFDSYYEGENRYIQLIHAQMS